MLSTLFPQIPSNRSLANDISALGAVICIWAGVGATWHWPLQLVAVVFSLGCLLDVLDGLVARKFNEATPGGAYFDALCDKVGEMALLIGLAWRTDDLETSRWLMLALATALLSSYAKPLAKEKGIIVHWLEAKIIGRGLRVGVLIAGLVICGLLGVPDNAALMTMAQVAFWTNLLIMAWRHKRIEISCFLAQWQTAVKQDSH